MTEPLLLKDRYLVLEELVGGGFGQTYIAEDTHLPSRRRCVIKYLFYEDEGTDQRPISSSVNDLRERP